MNTQVRYHDKWLRLIGYPLLGFIIRHFGEYESIGTLMKTRLYYGDLAWNTLIVAVCWETNRRLIFYLDRNCPWTANIFRRFIIQLFAALMLSIPIVAVMIYVWNELIIHRPNNFDTGYLLVYDFPLTIVFTLLVHMIYTGMYFYQYYTSTIEGLKVRVRELENAVAGVTEDGSGKEASPYRDFLIVNYGSSSVPVRTDSVAYIYKANELSFIKMLDGKEYTSSASLDTLEALLHPAGFFRLNRQMVGNVKAIRQFKPDSSGKLILEMFPPVNEEVTVSKKKASEFKSWIGRKV